MKADLNEKLIPEANIGTVGHVEHGKCIALDEDILVNNHLANGTDLKESAMSNGRLIRQEGKEKLYEMPAAFHIFSLDENFNMVRTKPLVFLQEYEGSMFKITTKSGRSIKVTPSHPFLVNRMGSLAWIPAELLNPKTDQICAISNLDIVDKKIELGRFIEGMSKDYTILTYNDFLNLKNRSDNFNKFRNFGAEDFNKLRIISGLSLSKLSGKIRFSPVYLGDVLSLKRQALSDKLRVRLSEFFASIKPDLHKDESVFLDNEHKGKIKRKKSPKNLD